MSNTWKIYMLTLISFIVGTSQFVISGILDQVTASVGVSVSTAGQLITAFALANAIGTPVVIVATTKMDQRKQLLLALAILLLGIISTSPFQASVLCWPLASYSGSQRASSSWGIGIFSLLAVFAVARTIPATEGKAPVPLGEQLTLLKQPRIRRCPMRYVFHFYRLFGGQYVSHTLSVLRVVE